MDKFIVKTKPKIVEDDILKFDSKTVLNDLTLKQSKLV